MRGRKRGRRDDDDGSDSGEDAPRPPPDAEGLPPGANGPRPPRSPAAHSLVVGGVAASPAQFPYQAGLVVTVRTEAGLGSLTSRCGAVLLSDRWLITAAHCCRRGVKVRVFLGAYPTMQDAQLQMETSLVLLHPKYSPNMPGHNDLALIRLPKPVIFTDKVRPVRLPAWRHQAEDFAGRIATLSGWGKTSDADERPSKGTAVLRFAKERILTTEEAEAILQRKLSPHFLCVRGLQGEVSCNGDSGGPLTVQGADGRPVLVGIVSHRYSNYCSTSRAHVCTRVTSFLPWIASTTRVAVEH